MTPDERNQYLKIPTHKERRDRGDLIETYKIIENRNLFTIKPASRRKHSKTIETPKCKTNLRQHSFSVRVHKKWNELPEDVVNAATLNQFKTKLDDYLA